MSAGNIEYIKIETLQLVRNGEAYDIYICPVCQKPKLYWYYNNSPPQAWCFHCSILFFEKDVEYIPEPEEESIFNPPLLCDGYKKTLLHKRPVKKEEIKSIPFLFPRIIDEVGENDVILNYLKKRNPFLPSLLSIVSLHVWSGRDVGIAAPFWFKGNVATFQVRWLEVPEDKPKYWTYPCQKFVYSPVQVFKEEEWTQQSIVTICEGVYDAIALLCMNYPCPVAVLGKTLTDLQISHIRGLFPEKLYLCFDKKEINDDVEKKIKRKFPSVEKIIKFAPWENTCQGDPEDHLRLILKTDPSLYGKIEKTIYQLKSDLAS